MFYYKDANTSRNIFTAYKLNTVNWYLVNIGYNAFEHYVKA